MKYTIKEFGEEIIKLTGTNQKLISKIATG
jgi:hypothetical protein